MALAVTQTETRSDEAIVAKAVVRAAKLLKVSEAALGRIIGASPATINRLRHRKSLLPADGKPYQLAVEFIRMFRSLDALLGGNTEQAAAWLHANNHDLNGTPAQLIETPAGLIHVVGYLDAMRGQ
jgi:hypothetical protein